MTEYLKEKIQKHEDTLSDLVEMSKMYSGHQFNLRLTNMVILRFPELAKKLNLKEMK